MNLHEAEELARQKMNEHGLYAWSFEFDRSVNRRGLCNYSAKKISLSKSLTQIRTEEAVLNTILHEIAHAIVGPFNGHGKVWFNKAVSIGCNGERCSSDVHEAIQPAFVGTCPGCSRTIERHRRKNISCGKCLPGAYSVKFRFKWVRR